MKVYYFEASPPARAVLMIIKALALDNVELIRVNLSEKEQLSEEFLKLNPTHTIPALDDDGFTLWDSHSIIQYLADKYGKSDKLYPKQLENRAIVNQMLFFDTSILFPSLANTVRPIFYDDATALHEKNIEKIESGFQFIEQFLNDRAYLAGEWLTIADISVLATVSTIEVFHPVNEEKYPNTLKWLNSLKESDFYTANLEGLRKFKEMLFGLLK